jgi:hypothetical protein
MAPITRSDETAMECILAILLEQPPIASTDTDLPKFRACFNEAGVTCASDFISISPSSYGGILFSSTNGGTDKDSTLNVIQIKKLSTLVSWFRQFPAPSATKWFDLNQATFRSWRTQPATPPVSTVTAPTAATAITAISAITDFRKGANTASLTTRHSRKTATLTHGNVIYKQLQEATMLTTLSICCMSPPTKMSKIYWTNKRNLSIVFSSKVS